MEVGEEVMRWLGEIGCGFMRGLEGGRSKTDGWNSLL